MVLHARVQRPVERQSPPGASFMGVVYGTRAASGVGARGDRGALGWAVGGGSASYESRTSNSRDHRPPETRPLAHSSVCASPQRSTLIMKKILGLFKSNLSGFFDPGAACDGAILANSARIPPFVRRFQLIGFATDSAKCLCGMDFDAATRIRSKSLRRLVRRTSERLGMWLSMAVTSRDSRPSRPAPAAASHDFAAPASALVNGGGLLELGVDHVGVVELGALEACEPAFGERHEVGVGGPGSLEDL